MNFNLNHIWSICELNFNIDRSQTHLNDYDSILNYKKDYIIKFKTRIGQDKLMKTIENKIIRKINDI